MSDFIPDLDSLRIAHTAVPAPKKRAPRHKAGEKFLKGPIPMSWLVRAGKLPGKAIHVGLSLWFYAGMRKSGQVNLPMRWLKMAFKMERHAVYRALVQLEKAGLASAIRHRGRATRVTLLEVHHD